MNCNITDTQHTCEIAVEFKGVSTSFGEKEVLHDVSFSIPSGEFISLTGTSGSGKTTVLKHMNGLLMPSKGSVLICGKDTKDIDLVKLRRSMGYVIQGSALFPHMKVLDNITYIADMLRVDENEKRRRVQWICEICDIAPNLLGRWPQELSGGQAQRIGIARALLMRPSVMLMDEPLGAVDDITRQALRRELKRIHTKLETTFIMVTHALDEALELSDRIIVMNAGRIEQFATPQEIVERPQTHFVEELFASQRPKNTAR